MFPNWTSGTSMVAHASLAARLRIFVLLVPLEEVVAPESAGRYIPGNEAEVDPSCPVRGVFLILDHAGHALSCGGIEHGEGALEFGAALWHEHAHRVGTLPAAGVERGHGSEGVSGPPEGVREAVDARPYEGVGSLESGPRETRFPLSLERPRFLLL